MHMADYRKTLGFTLVGGGLAALFINVFSLVNASNATVALYTIVVAMALLAGVSQLLAWPWRLLAGLLATLGALWWVAPLRQAPGPIWLYRLVLRCYQQILGFIQSGQMDMANTLSNVLAVLLVVCVVYMVHQPHLPLFAAMLVGSYLAVVHVLNQITLTGQFCLFAGLVLFAQLVKHWHRRTMASFALCCALIGGVYYATLNGNLTNAQLIQHTLGLRTWLNNQGFFARIDAYVNGPARTGFSENDETLGGPVHDDPTPVLTVRAKTRQYLRVQFKSNYTGSGWDNTMQGEYYFTENPIVDPYARTQAPGPAQNVTITRAKDFNYLTLPYGQVTITDPDVTLHYNPDTGQIMGSDVIKQSLHMKVVPQQPTAAQLRMASGVPTRGTREVALPKLPQRVADLAKRLTQKQPTQYDKVKAVEQYLATDSAFTYSKSDTPRTPDGHDYVDYFLFDSQVGYCDNFSSAMVVLLRAVGISARWAKGFAPGHAGKTTNGRTTYTITNSDAHSWPEVYFGEYGWLRFEPTPGFATTTTRRQTTQASASSSARSSAASSSTTSSSSSRRQTAAADQTAATSAPHPLRWVIGLGLLGLVLLLSPRLILLPALTWHKLKPRHYRWLLWYLQHTLLARHHDQTLRNYAPQVDAALDLPGTFAAVTTAYERESFGNHPKTLAASVEAFRQVVKALILRKHSAWLGVLRQCRRKHH